VTDPSGYYAAQGPTSDPGAHSSALDGLPADVSELCEVIQGLLVHPYWAPVYGWTMAKEREADLQLRLVARMLGRILELDGQL
jgi:hypothetical protein